MMVPQPTRTLDLQRKEELIIQKQIRQSTAKVKQNLPTLIEASPDFNSKKLPYLPYLPDSVQSLGTYGGYDDNDINESVVTDDLPSLYSVPHKLRSESRCSSITFDLTDAEGYNRNRSKSRKRKEKDKKESREESQANIFARDEPEVVERGHGSRANQRHVESVTHGHMETMAHGQVDDEPGDILSMWSCRRCTLENPLHEAVCLACGGSRLSSIGDIEVPRIVEPKNLVNLIADDDDVLNDFVEEENINNTNRDKRWKCKICTLENEPYNYYCDACNSPNPRKDEIKNKPGQVTANREVGDGLQVQETNYWEFVNKAVRYVGIACFFLIILCALINMVTSFINMVTYLLTPGLSGQTPTPPKTPHVAVPHPNNVGAGEQWRESSDRLFNDRRELNDAHKVTEISNKMNDADTAETEDVMVNDFAAKSDIEQQINDPETDKDNVANIDSVFDNLQISGIFCETFGFLPIIFIVYWPIFLFLIAKFSKISVGSPESRVPRVAQPM